MAGKLGHHMQNTVYNLFCHKGHSVPSLVVFYLIHFILIIGVALLFLKYLAFYWTNELLAMLPIQFIDFCNNVRKSLSLSIYIRHGRWAGFCCLFCCCLCLSFDRVWYCYVLYLWSVVLPPLQISWPGSWQASQNKVFSHIIVPSAATFAVLQVLKQIYQSWLDGDTWKMHANYKDLIHWTPPFPHW